MASIADTLKLVKELGGVSPEVAAAFALGAQHAASTAPAAPAEVRPDYAAYESIADWLKERTKYRPSIFIVCGTGLSRIADLLTETDTFEYCDIPGFPVSTVEGHAGRLIFGMLGGKQIGCMKGRFHSYEGYPMWKVTLPVRVMRLMGASRMIVTNAAGGLNQDFNIGDIMIMQDHINFPGMAGRNPLVGPNIKEFGPRFSPMTFAYDRQLQALAKACSSELKLDAVTRKGVYAMVSGPNYETPSECKMLLGAGADVVGMSTAPEVTVATHCGFKCLGFSLVTNKAVLDLDSTDEPNHAEVLEAGAARAGDMNRLVSLIVERMEID